MPTAQDTSARNGARLNYLYQQYQRQPNSTTQNALYAEVQNYAERLVTILAKANSIHTDSIALAAVVQDAVIKLSEQLGQFEHRSKFSSWFYPIVRSAFYDELRRNYRRREAAVSDEKHNGEYAGRSNSCQDSLTQEGDSDSSGWNLISPRELSSEEDKLNLQLDRQRLEASLSDEDFEIFQSYLEGESAEVTAKRLLAGC